MKRTQINKWKNETSKIIDKVRVRRTKHGQEKR